MGTQKVAKKADHQVAKLRKVVDTVTSSPKLKVLKGIEDVGESNMDIVEAYLASRFDFRRNIVIDKTEFKLRKEHAYRRLTERDYNSIYRLLNREVAKITKSDLRSLLNSDFVVTYDPIVEYFTGLPKWDGKTDYILQLAKTVKTNNDALWQECLKKWLVAMVASAIKENEVNHTVLVFSGKQGVGKTTWHMNLVPPVLSDYKYSGAVRPDNKDAIINLSECLLINLDELESMNKSEIGDLKEMITKSAIRIRRPYGFQSEKMKRRASFCGSVNKSQFLNDATGSRRFLCFEAIDIDYQKKINMDQVYSQAMHLLNSGYQYWFDQAGIDKITANNAGYQVVRMEEDLLLKNFTHPKTPDEAVYFTTTEIAEVITRNVKTGVSDAFVQNLGKTLAKYHFERKKHRGVYKYSVKRLRVS